MSISKANKKTVFRLFAAGDTPERVVEKFEKLREKGQKALLTQARAEMLYEEYLTLRIGEKLRLTLMTENVSNRLHRLMDDISDLSLVDGLLSESDKKALALLLDIKRKIKERMSKEFTRDGETASNPTDEKGNNEIDEFWEKSRGKDADGKQA